MVSLFPARCKSQSSRYADQQETRKPPQRILTGRVIDLSLPSLELTLKLTGKEVTFLRLAMSNASIAQDVLVTDDA